MIRKLRVSFIWTRTILDMFRETCTASNPLDLFLRPTGYKDFMISLYKKRHPWLTHPWQLQDSRNKTNWFWKYYLNDCNPLSAPHDMIAKRAFPRHVPFRTSIGKDIDIQWPETFSQANRFALEGYFFRHGVALVSTFSLHDCSSLEEAVEQVMDLRYKALYSLPSTGSGKRVSLSRICQYGLDTMCQKMQTLNDWFDEEPFLLVGVLEGDDQEKQRMVQEGNNTHRAFEALASLDRGWKKRLLPSLIDNTISIKNSQPGDILYGHQNSRVLWIPRLFSDQARYSLVWYYRNLLMASMMVKSFRDFLVRANSVSLQGIPRVYGYARTVTPILRKMRDGCNTYCTKSVYRQISTDTPLQQAFITFP